MHFAPLRPYGPEPEPPLNGGPGARLWHVVHPVSGNRRDTGTAVRADVLAWDPLTVRAESAARLLADPRSDGVATVGTVPVNDPSDLAAQGEVAQPLT